MPKVSNFDACRTQVAGAVVDRINEQYELDQGLVNHVKTFIMESIDTNQESLRSALTAVKTSTKPKAPKLTSKLVEAEIETPAATDQVVVDTKLVAKAAAPTVKKPRKKSGYNIFVKEKMPDLADMPHKDRMRKIGELWKALNDKDRLIFNQKATDLAEVAEIVG